MKILFTSTLKRKVTKDEQSSRATMIYHIAKGMVDRGHEVALLGTGDSEIEGASIIPVVEKGWVNLAPTENDFFRDVSTLALLGRKTIEFQNQFDLIHNHTYPDFYIPQFEDQLIKPLITTIHIQGTDYIDQTLSQFKKTHFVSISKAHRALFKKTNIPDIIYNGIDTNLYAYHESKDDYLLWLGRLSKAKNEDGSFQDPKGVRWAIKLAQETGSNLKLAGNVEDIAFFNNEVKPYLNDKIQWIGPVSSELSLTKQQVVDLYQKAKVFLMTINWYEPFGLVMIEAMSCGTPVIGFDRGSVSEVIDHGKTGFVVNPDGGVDELKQALEKISSIKPRDCRDRVENNFSTHHMVDRYEELYKQLAE